MRGNLWLGAASAALFAAALAAPAHAQEVPGDASTEARVSAGGETAGRIDTAGDTDWFRLSADSNQRYQISLNSAPGEGEEGFDTMLFVYDESGTQVAYNDDSNGTLNSEVFFTPTQSGDLFVEARSYNDQSTGGYTLRVQATQLPQDDAANGDTTSARLATGRTVSGNIEYEGDVDWYRMSVRTGQVYTIRLVGGEGALGDPYLSVVSAGGVEITANDDDGEGLNSLVEFTPQHSGDVFVVASAFANAGVGSYTLTANSRRLPPDNASADIRTRGRIAVGEALSQTLDYSGDRDWYRIRLEEGETYRFRLNSDGASPVGDPLLRLFSASGEELAMDDDGGGNLNSLLEFQAPTTGNYFLEAGSYTGDGEGSYSLHAMRGDIPGDATTDVTLATEGDYREGMLSPAGDQDWYRIELPADSALRISLLSAESQDALADPYLVFYGPNGEELARDDDSGDGLNSWIEYQTTAEGPYFIGVRGFSEDAVGRYYLVVQPGEIGDSAETADVVIPNGEGRTSVIGANGDVDWFAVELIEARPYRINVQGVDADPLADPYVVLYNSEGQQVIADDDGGFGLNPYISYASPTGGPHYIAVSAYAGTGAGRYLVSVLDTEVPGHIYTDENVDPAGDARVSAIDLPSELDYFRVELEGGVRYQIEVTSTGEHPLADPFLTITDAENTRVTSDDDSGSGLDARVRFTPETSGTYYIQASGLGGSTGSYQVSVARQ